MKKKIIIIMSALFLFSSLIYAYNNSWSDYSIPDINFYFSLPSSWTVDEQNDRIIAFSPGNEIFFIAQSCDTIDPVDYNQNYAEKRNSVLIGAIRFINENYGILLTTFNDRTSSITGSVGDLLFLFDGWAIWQPDIPDESLKYILAIKNRGSMYLIVLAIGYAPFVTSNRKTIATIMEQIR